MADAGTIGSVGQQLTDVLTAAYATTDAATSLVYLPGGVSVPADLVQQGLINPVAVQAFLTINFDSPFVMSLEEGTIHGRDGSHGAASEIYLVAATQAQPAAPVGSDTWKRYNALIARAGAVLGLAASNPDIHLGLACEPSDWMVPERADYWTRFDSGVQATSAPPSSPPPAGATGGDRPRLPVVSPRLWSIRPEVLEPRPPEPAPVEHPWHVYRRRFGDVAAVETMQTAMRASPALRTSSGMASVASVAASPALAAAVQMNPSIRALSPGVLRAPLVRLPLEPADGVITATSAARAVDWHKLLVDLPKLPPPEQTPPASTSTEISVRLEHQSVTLDRVQGGTAWWNDVFLADPGWYVPGMKRGGLLPAPADESPTALRYGLPIALVVVRNLEIRGRWSGPDAALLRSQAALLGPFSLAGSAPAETADGFTTWSRPGAQIVALLCRPLPVLPPQDAPADSSTPVSPATS